MAEDGTTSPKTLQDILGVKFTWYDSSFFILILMLSVFIGIYYGFYKKQKTTNDYLLGGKSMSVLPVALSLIANNVSGIALLAMPPDIYNHGIGYWFTYFAVAMVAFTSYYLFVPVFYKLGKTSTFEYLKLRFDSKTRLLGSALFLISRMLYLPIVIYIPALALTQATGINLHLVCITLCIVCIFYTSIGGLKAVVYSDALQSTVMIGALIIALTLGVVKVGGFGNLFTTSYENNRLDVSLDLDFTERNSIWAVTIGSFAAWTAFTGVNQIYIQKCLSLPTKLDVMKVLVVFAIGILGIGTLCGLMGLVMFTEYVSCDPVKAGILQKPDQLLPYFIMDISKKIPGLAGLFVAGIFSAALSTLSATLNSLSCTIYEDFFSRYIPKDTSQEKISAILKIIVVIIGGLCTSLVLVVERLGGLLALANSLEGVTSGSVLGLFVAGMLVPDINAKGAFYGSVGSMMVMTFVVFGSQWYQNSGHITDPSLPVSTDGCPSELYITSAFTEKINHTSTSIPETTDVPYIFRIQFYWYTLMGLTISLIIGLAISLFTRNNRIVDRDLLSPIVHRFISQKCERRTTIVKRNDYSSLENALNVIETADNK